MTSDRKKVIYVYPDHFEKRDYERFGVDIVKKQYSVEIWSLVDCIYKHKISVPDSIYCGKEVTYFQKWNDYGKAVSRNKNCIFFDFSHMAEHEFKIKRALIKYNCTYMNFYFAPIIPDVQDEKNDEKKLNIKKKIEAYLKLLFQFKFKEIAQKILALAYGILIYRKKQQHDIELVKKYPPEIYFIATDYCKKIVDIYAKKIVKIHALDFDKYINNIYENDNFNDGRYIVYLDQNIIEHPDYEKEGIIPFSSKEKTEYYKEMENFFDVLEKQYGCEVIIATHPRANYKGKIFGNRKMIAGNTSRLVQSAELVLTHDSTSINFAIIYKKDILLLTSEALRNHLGDFTLKFERRFNFKVIDISSICENDYIQVYRYSENIKTYDDFRNMLIKEEGTTSSSFFECVLNSIAENEEKK